jgi:hypothetical protein
VNFETPDHQTSQITAGQSQQISGNATGKFQLGERRMFKPSNSAEFFNHAGGLLEHASGNGVVRHKLGPDIYQTLHEKGYELPREMQERFKNAAHAHFKHRPPFNRQKLHRTRAAAPAGKEKPMVNAENHPAAPPARHPIQPAENRRTPEEERDWERQQRLAPGADGMNDKDKKGNR